MLLSQASPYFKARRDSLMQANPGAAFLFPSSQELVRNPDVTFPFRQESNFFYLTGFEEAESFLVLAHGKTVLFVRHRDPEKEMWEGERYGVEGARQVFGADEAFTIDQLEAKLPEILKGSDQIFYRIGTGEAADRQVLGLIDKHRRSLGSGGKGLPPIADPNGQLGEMRLFKKAEEVADLRRACEITALAHKTAMEQAKPGMNEFEVEALVDYVLRKSGCQRVGYGSIVAGGKNAACLHYRANNEVLRDRELLLIDAGGEYNYYTSDITRTFPVGREFTAPQAKLYDLVLKSQKEAIALARPGATIPQIHRRATDVLIDGMLSLGLIQGTPEEIFKSGAYKRFYPHTTSHWLGMDVHDVGHYQKDGEPRPFEPGMCFTIEPGFYVQPGDLEAPVEFRNIGIRIEDDILITATGHDVLTKDAPKERAEIEALKKA
jgi:Xaa-Pro aminopeptidase